MEGILCPLFVLVKSLCVLSQLPATPWTEALQAPLSMGFSRQEYWSGLPFLPPSDLPNPGMEPTFLMSPALADSFFTATATWEAPVWWWQGKCFYFLLPMVKGLCSSNCF